MVMMVPNKWLLLLYGLSAKKSAQRVSLWRKLKKIGAVQLKPSTYVLPDEPRHFERFQWLAKQVRDGSGEATLIRATQIEGLIEEQIIGLFNHDRVKDYRELIELLTRLISRNKKQRTESFESDLERLNRRSHEIQETDYFDCPAAHDAQMLIKRAEGLLKPKPKLKASVPLDPKKFSGKTWLTRPRPEIDRVGSAWLIRRFIDPRAQFIFSTRPTDHPGSIPYDMLDAEFSHHGEDCTFETLVKRFGVLDKAVLKIAEMVHDTDLEDGKFQRSECMGIYQVLQGWAKIGLSDEELLSKGAECFEALYQQLRKS